MSEQPKIRQVTRGRYVTLLLKWMICFMLAWVCAILGGGLLVLQLYDAALGFAVACHAPIQAELPLEMSWQGPQFFLVLLVGGTLAFAGRKLFVRTLPGVPFAPITSQNSRLLPAAESLVRAWMPGPQSQQAELLRPAPSGHDLSPQNQLLRATEPPHGSDFS